MRNFKNSKSFTQSSWQPEFRQIYVICDKIESLVWNFQTSIIFKLEIWKNYKKGCATSFKLSFAKKCILEKRTRNQKNKKFKSENFFKKKFSGNKIK